MVIGEALDRLDDAAARMASTQPSAVTLVGAGSSHLVGGVVGEVLQRRTGLPAHALVASDVGYDAGHLRGSSAPVVAVSRSGRTTETLAAVQALRKADAGPVWAFTCEAESPLALTADEVVAVPSAAEAAVAQTRSVAVALCFGLLVAERVTGRDGRSALADTAAALRRHTEPWLAETARTASAVSGRLVVLGGAERWWLAREIALKAAEMGRVPVLAERVLEVPHGPVEALAADDTVVVLPSPPGTRTAALEGQVTDRLESMCRVVVLGRHVCAGDITEPLLAQLYGGHLLALAVATARGVDADQPARLAPYLELGDG
jgi:glutamine---fructose-6-phosphate transaminase (isomerizing)